MGDGKIYLVNEACAVTVVKPAAQWEVLAVNQLEDRCIATPAIADGRLFIRTSRHLYAFGDRMIARSAIAMRRALRLLALATPVLGSRDEYEQRGTPR